MKKLYIPIKDVNLENIKVGDKIKFKKEKTTPYLVQARNEKYIICTRPRPAGSVFYIIIDLEEKVRGADNALFSNGYGSKRACQKNLKQLENDFHFGVSHRNRLPLDIIFVRHI